jgi:hypothetical protein
MKYDNYVYLLVILQFNNFKSELIRDYVIYSNLNGLINKNSKINSHLNDV